LRQDHRAAQFARYFARAGLAELDWRKVAIFPAPQFSLYRLLAFEDQQGYTLGLGILREIDRQTRRLVVLTPLDSLGGVRAIRVGSMEVDPVTYQGTRI
jgi:hypothetical protein